MVYFILPPAPIGLPFDKTACNPQPSDYGGMTYQLPAHRKKFSVGQAALDFGNLASSSKYQLSFLYRHNFKPRAIPSSKSFCRFSSQSVCVDMFSHSFCCYLCLVHQYIIDIRASGSFNHFVLSQHILKYCCHDLWCRI